MAMPLRVEVIRKEMIKPSSPTPPHLKRYNLSVMDQFIGDAYGAIILFYPNPNIDNIHDDIHSRLKTSLSSTLTVFYPLAGRANHTFIDCNDEGAEFVEARLNSLLTDFLKQPRHEVLKQLIPISTDSAEASTGRVLLIQSTLFECGGMSIGVIMSHKVADASSISTFISSWSSTAFGSHAHDHVLPVPRFASVFPTSQHNFSKAELSSSASASASASDNNNMPAAASAPPPPPKIVRCRLVFDAPNLAALKAKAAGATVQHPSRVEVVSALIGKCASKAARSRLSSVSSTPKLISFMQLVNLRSRLDPPAPETSIGNFLGFFEAVIKRDEEKEVEFKDLVVLLREAFNEFLNNGMKKYESEEAFLEFMSSQKEQLNVGGENNIEIEFYVFTSCCRSKFYEADFGWGKPEWVGVITHTYKNIIVLNDTKDGAGIEAWVTLTEEDMSFFQQDQQLLAFASLYLDGASS